MNYLLTFCLCGKCVTMRNPMFVCLPKSRAQETLWVLSVWGDSPVFQDSWLLQALSSSARPWFLVSTDASYLTPQDPPDTSNNYRTQTRKQQLLIRVETSHKTHDMCDHLELILIHISSISTFSKWSWNQSHLDPILYTNGTYMTGVDM